MEKLKLYNIREWVKDNLELAYTWDPPSRPAEVQILEDILILTTECDIK